MPFTIIHADITQMKVDAIVNPARPDFQMDEGICSAIFRAAGIEKLQNACSKLTPVEPGRPVITSGFDLPAKHIIHMPVFSYKDGKHGEAEMLRYCYLRPLVRASVVKYKSIAFPLLPGDTHNYPAEEALRIASKEIQNFLAMQEFLSDDEEEMDICLVISNKTSFVINPQLLVEVDTYFRSHYSSYITETNYAVTIPQPLTPETGKEIDKRLDNLGESFSQTLLQMIEASGKTHAQVYKRANIDRKLFHKIKSRKGYMPGKRTVIALAIALELPLRDARRLLEKAGHSLADNQELDVIVEFFITNGRYDIFEINEVLFHYGQPLLGV